MAKYLSLGASKKEFIEFLFHQWKQDCFATYFKGILYMIHGEFYHCFCAKDGQVICTTVDELCSSHEETDTRQLLHAFHVSCEEHQQSIVIQTPDTVIASSAACDIPSQILLHTGTKHRQ